MSDSDSYDHLFKVVLVGDSGVGKSTLLSRFTAKESKMLSRLVGGIISRFIRGVRSPGSESAGDLVATRTIHLDGKAIKASVWDTSPERFRTEASTYFQGVAGVLILYDVTSSATFENVKMWLNEIRDHSNENMVIMLIGNKADLCHTRVVSAEEGRAFSEQENIFFTETSALNLLDVENVFTEVLRQIYGIVSANVPQVLDERNVVLDLKDGLERASSSRRRRWKWSGRRRKKETTDVRLYKAVIQNDTGLLEGILAGDRSELVINIPGGSLDMENNCGNDRQRHLSGITVIGDTILHVAARFRNVVVAEKICRESKFLLKRGNYRSETPLHYAVQTGNLELVTRFVNVALEEGNIALQKYLRRRNSNGETALYQAVQYKKFSIVQKLVNASTEDNLSVAKLVSICDNNGVSPVYIATVNKSTRIVSSLIEPLRRMLPLRAYAGPNGLTALHVAAAIGEKGLIEKLVDCMPELIKAKDESGNTPLHYGASSKSFKAIKILMHKDKSQALVANSLGLYAVHIASKLGNLEVLVEISKDCPGFEELRDREGRTFLHLAVEERRNKVVQWVCGFRHFERAINAQDSEGNTALHLAVKYKEVAIFGSLMSSKLVKLNLANNSGLTPFDIVGAQKSITPLNWQNADYVMWTAFSWIEFFSTMEMRKRIKVETDEEKKERLEKEKEEVDMYANIARVISIGSVLIASATMALLFTVAGIFLKKSNKDRTSMLISAFEVFVVMDVHAFLCSLIATSLLIQASLSCLDAKYRQKYLVTCTQLVMMATKGCIVAFGLGAYVVVGSVSKWLAMFICVAAGCVAPLLIQPHYWPSLLLPRIVIRNRGWVCGCYLMAVQLFHWLFEVCVYSIIVGLLLISNPNKWSSCIPESAVVSFLAVGYCPNMYSLSVVILLVASYIYVFFLLRKFLFL